MRRMKNFMFSGLLLAAVSVSAEVPPSIHVDGKNLTDTHGNKVVLHGVMDTPSPYFNNYRWGNAANDATKKDCIEYFDKLFTAITDSTQGAYCNVFRLHLDPCWTNDPNLPVTGEETGEANISQFSEKRLRTYLSTLYWKIIEKAYNRLNRQGIYSHSKLIAEMEFGVWKYMYSSLQYRVTGQCLLRAFPNKPRSSAAIQYNNTYIFNELDKVNSLRNRIAHHEPICFRLHASEIDTSYIVNEYQKIQTLFSWMGIDSRSMLYGLDHVQSVCSKINALK